MANQNAVISKNPNTKGSGLTLGTSYDSGNILINARSGSGPQKQVDGTQQSATTLASSAVTGVASNFLEGSNQNNEKSPAPITNIAITANVVTVTCVNNFSVGQNIQVERLTVATFLNLVNLVVATVSGTQFTAAFVHANYGSAADTGIATYTNTSRASGLSINKGG